MIGERAAKVFPGGISNGEFGLAPDKIVVIARGEGCRLWDSGEREYLDFSIGWGSCLVGHANPEVVDAVCQQVPMGSNFAYLNPHALAVAKRLRASLRGPNGCGSARPEPRPTSTAIGWPRR